MRLILGTLTAILVFQAAGAEVYDLDRQRVVELALERNEHYQAVKLERTRVRGQYLEARAGALPRLDFDATYMRNIDLQTSVFTTESESGETEQFKIRFGTPHNYSAGFSLYQPLYAAGKVGAAIKIARHGFSYTDAVIDAARHDVTTEADRAYLDAVAAREAVFVFSEAEKLADSNLAVIQKLYDQGQTSEYDLLRAQVQAANSRPDRIAAANQARLALDNLRTILALSPEDEIILEDSIAIPEAPQLNIDSLHDEAIANRPELHQAEEWINVNEELVSIAKSDYKPSLGINSRLQWDSFVDKFSKTRLNNWNRSWNVAVVLTWPIFSGFETVGRVRQARVDYNQSQLEKQSSVRRVHLEVRDMLGRVNEAQERVAAIGETVTQAERGLDIARVRFRNGVGTQLELLDAQLALTTARVNRISAIHDLAVAISGLRRAVGREWGINW